MEDDWAGAAEDGQQQEFEVEDILRYRRNEAGEEYFLVKWIGFPEAEATWEPLAHMNDNCRELIAKARAFFAWRRPSAPSQPLAEVPEAPEDYAEAAEEEPDDAEEAEKGAADEEPPEAPRRAPARPPPGLPGQRPKKAQGVGAEDDAGGAVTKRGEAAAGAHAAQKRARLQLPAGAAGPLDGSTSSQAKAQRPANGTTRSAPTPPSASPPGTAPTPPPTPPPRTPSKVPVSTEMKCICGANDKIDKNAKGPFVVCKVCNCSLHSNCVEGALNGAAPADFVCPPCRLERVDEFHPPVGAGLLRHNYASCSSTFSLSFTAQATQWRKQQWAVHLRAVHLGNHDLGGPAWPHRVQGKLNGRQCVAIDPPKHLHVRREQCYNLTPLLRQGVNTLELKFTPRPDKPREEPEEGYCVGVVLTRPRSVASIIARIRTRSTETVASGRQRVERLLAQVASREGAEEECKVTGNFGRTLKPLCPVSLCPIEEAAIGRVCNHIQVFDLQAYIAVNQRMRSLDKRWTCPVCSLSLRPDDVILDPFVQGILDTLRGDEDTVEAVVFSDDCTWSTVSAVKENEKEKAPPAAGEEEAQGDAPGAELIDLEDSE
mmetsp:Transcript_88154/g.273136  ORF Transcript_88154/g.273136 Transcript_88154/m.273136 type:complete len:600 (-) Transcript_88154:135-1934(-)